MPLRIIFLVGIWYFPMLYGRMPKLIGQELLKKFPGATFEIRNTLYSYSPWQRTKMLAWCEELVLEFKDRDEEILLVGHSMGALIACLVAGRLKHVRGVLAIFGPFTTFRKLFSRMLGVNLGGLGEIPVVSFEGTSDWCVLYGTEYPDTGKHVSLESGHLLWPIYSSTPAKLIARAASEVFARD